MKTSVNNPLTLHSRLAQFALAGAFAVLPILGSAQSVLDMTYDPRISKSSEGAAWTSVQSMAINPGKKLIVGGHFARLGIPPKNRYFGSFARLADSGLDDTTASFVAYPWAPLPYTIPISDSSSDPWVWATHVSPDWGMLVMGNFTEISGESRNQMAFLRLKDASATFYNAPMVMLPPPGGPRPEVIGGVILPSGEPIYIGDWEKADGVTSKGIAKQIGALGELAASSAFDALLESNSNPVPVMITILRQADGKILASGIFDTADGQNRPHLVRLDPDDGGVDTGFNHPLTSPPAAMVLQPDGKLLVASSYETITPVTTVYGIIRLNSNGTRDVSFVPAEVAGVSSMVLRADGNIVIGGSFTVVTGSNGTFTRNGVAMITPTGAIVPDFDPNVEASNIEGAPLSAPFVEGLAIQEDGKVVIGGGFSKVSGVNRIGLARMTAEIPAISDLEISTDRSTITWTRQGSAPEIHCTKFQVSTNGGKTFTDLPLPTYSPGIGWVLTGQALSNSTTFQLRATGNATSGWLNNSAGLVERILKPIADFTIDQPDALTVVEGDPASFHVEARSSINIISYQWRRNGVNVVDGPNVTGATSPTLNISAALAADGGTYTVVVRTAAGTATSAGALLKVIIPPAVITNPIDLVVGKGKPVKLTAKFSGTDPEYQWTGPFPLNASGQESLTLSFSNAQDAHEGVYTITATNAAGVATTLPVTLTVVDPPAVAVTNNVMAGLGTAPVLSATVTAEAPSSLKYQWLKVTAAVSGATSATYTMTNIQLSQAGAYSLRATNPAGTITGARGEVAVVDNVNDKTQVQKETGTAIFTAAAAGNGLTYVWKFTPAGGGPQQTITADGTKYFITAGGKTLTVKSLALGDAGDYIAEVTNVAGMLATAPEHLFVTTGLPVLVGPMTFTENAMVNAPFSFQVDDGMNDNAKPASYKMTISPALTGLTISKTGLISGRPQKAGTFTITVTGTNAHGTSIAITGTLTVEPIPTNAIGKFVAIVGRNATTNANLGGRVDLTVTPVGSYSGKLFMGALSYSFSGGKLNVNAAGDTNTGTIDNPTNIITVARKGTTPLTLSFDLNLGNNTIAGAVTDGVNSADLDGWRLVWSKTTPVQASDYLGRFNFTYLAPDESPAQTYPHGYGFGSALIPATGTVTVSGTLADGTAYSTASFVGPQGQLAVFKTLYSNTGSILGTHQIASATGAVTDYALPAAFSWLKKDQAPKVVYSYGAGFGPIDLAVAGSRYDPLLITSAVNVLGSDVATADTKLDFSDAGLAVATINPDVTFTLNAANKAVFTSNLGKVKLTVTKSTGRFTGTYSLLDDIDGSPAVVKNVPRTGKFNGVVVRNTAGTTGEGRGYHLLSELPILPTTSTAKTAILSGPVVLSDVTP